MDQDAFAPFVESICEQAGDGEEADEQIRESVTSALADWTDAAGLATFAHDLILFWRGMQKRKRDLDAELLAEKKKQAALKLESSLVLRSGQPDGSSGPASEKTETEDERRAREELIKRFDSVGLDEDDSAVASVGAPDASHSSKLDNVQRVKQAEAEKRRIQKEEAARQKSIAKKSGADGKKKREEAKEKRRQKAGKVERKG